MFISIRMIFWILPYSTAMIHSGSMSLLFFSTEKTQSLVIFLRRFSLTRIFSKVTNDQARAVRA
jgi:hypothetical protein